MTYGGKELARSFRTVRSNTIKIAEEIPEEKYGFRPAEGCRSIAETLVHIKGGDFGAGRPFSAVPHPRNIQQGKFHGSNNRAAVFSTAREDCAFLWLEFTSAKLEERLQPRTTDPCGWHPWTPERSGQS